MSDHTMSPASDARGEAGPASPARRQLLVGGAAAIAALGLSPRRTRAPRHGRARAIARAGPDGTRSALALHRWAPTPGTASTR